MKPTRIYWNALRSTEILCNSSMSFDDACLAVANYNKKNQNITIKYESGDDGGDSDDAGMVNLTIFNAPCLQKIDDYISNPTLHLTKEEASYLRDQFLHIPVMKNTLMEYCLKTKRTFFDKSLKEIEKQNDMPDILKHNLELATEFANFIYGAYIVYNLLFFENGGEYATDDMRQYLENRYKDWKQNNNGIPHIDNILELVKNHEHYKHALRDFLIQFERAVKENVLEKCSAEEKTIIKDRERFCKREKSRIGRNYPYQEIQSTPMNYRHGTGQTIIIDIMKGLVREDGKA